MADERKIGAVKIDRLYDFLDGLQASGYTIDPRQYLALSDLLMALIARENSLEELPLKTLIAPLICSNPAEQQDFYQRFDRWYVTLLPVASGKDRIEELTSTLLDLTKQTERNFPNISRKTVIWTLVVFAIIALTWLILRSGTNITLVPINTNIIFYIVFIGLFALTVLIGRWVWILVQENQYITRKLARQEPVYTKVPVKSYMQEIMPVMQFKPIVTALRKRTQVPSAEVDVGKTIENALNRNNWLEIVYRQRQIIPEYVVLIDRKSRLDQQARFVQEILAKLATDGVWLHQYEFSGDPRICFPLDRKDTPLRLKDLRSRHPDSRLLVFSGMNELLNPLTGFLQDWLESLSHWPERAILTPDKLQKVFLEELQSRDFAVLPMTFDGLASLVRTFEADNVPILTSSETNPPAPLTERPMRWTGRVAPPESEVKALVAYIRNYLGENGFYWLCAIAVYPEMRWELTLHLGNALRDDFGKPLLNPDALIRLARLPWFRIGYMPDWFRLTIINSFTQIQEERVRNVLRQLLSTAYQGKDFDLIFSQRDPDTLGIRVRRLLNTIMWKSNDIYELKDQIFVKFVIKPQSKKLSIALPENIRNALPEVTKSALPEVTQSVLPKNLQESSDKDQVNLEIETESTTSVLSQSHKSTFSTIKPRVLIVENRLSTRVAKQSLLLEWGYDPVLAMGAGAFLLADAKTKAREMRCALALIDLRLADDYDEQDTSGLKLAEELGDSLRPIILSGHDNPNVLRKLLQKHLDMAFISKNDSRDSFQEILDAEAAKVTAAKRKLVFENPETLEEIANSSLGKNAGDYPDQIADVFAQLFPKAEKLRFEKLELRPTSSNISTVPRPNSVVLKVYEGTFEPVVVKLARAEKIKKEVENYNLHIHRRLTGNFAARLERSATLWDIGGAAYSYVGEFDVKTFSRYYEEKTAADIEECLSLFFGRLWGRHYEQAWDKENVSLFKLYSQVWDDWYEKRKDDFFVGRFNGSDMLSKKLNIPEPIKWFREKIAESPNDLSLVKKTRMAITHGDLHGDNLLVDNKKNVWVIDFERCGEGHILQDFVELEADIFNRLEEHNDNFPAYFKMCFTVLNQKKIQGFESSETTSEDPRIEKALQTISALRSLAAKYTKITDAREYLFGLLFNMMFRAAMIHKTDPHKKNQRSLLLASLICDRLDHWDKPWSLAEMKL